MSAPAICQIVPTKDRPELLARLFESLVGQEQWLRQLIIVDGSDEPVRAVCEQFDKLPITYQHVQPPGLARQRNAGLELIAADIDLVGFWDDDLVIGPGALQAMSEFWEQASPEVGGAEYNIMLSEEDMPARGGVRGALDRVFLLDDPRRPGAILASGEAVNAFPAQDSHEVEWLCGGANLYRREVFRENDFDEWFDAYGVGDDIEFSYRVSQRGQLWIVAPAQVQHLPVEFRPGSEFALARVRATNHLYFVQNNSDRFSRLLGAWSVVGRGVRSLVGGLRTGNAAAIASAAGHFSAIPPFFLGRLKPILRQLR